jgi:hypothetical protein
VRRDWTPSDCCNLDVMHRLKISPRSHVAQQDPVLRARVGPRCPVHSSCTVSETSSTRRWGSDRDRRTGWLIFSVSIFRRG